MKTIKQIFKVLALLMLIVSCDANEYDAPPAFTDLAFTTTFGASTLREGEVDRFISFMDMSAGATHHEWRIPKGAFFLKGPIPNNLDNHDAFITNPGDTISTEKTVHVLFKKGDSNTIIELYDEFADSTSFVIPSYWDTTINGTVYDTIKTNMVDGKWIAQYQIVLDVYDTLAPTLEIEDMSGNIVDQEAVDTLYLTFGDELVLRDLTGLLPDNNGRPTSTNFRVRSIEENEEDVKSAFSQKTEYEAVDFADNNEATVTFNKFVGNFRAELISARERTETLKSQNKTYVSPVVFKISPLDEDLVPSGGATESADNSIVITMSSRLQTIESSVHANFSVTVDGTPVDVLSVLSERNGNDLVVTLANPLEPEDAGKVVEISYDGLNAEIKSLDERPLQAFTESIDVYVPVPLSLDGAIVSDADNGKILIKFDEDIDAATVTGATNAADGFTVMLNSMTATISSVTVNATDASILELTLAEGVYHDDVITVEFSGATTSEIKSIGEGGLNDFGTKTVVHNLTNLLADSSFEGTFGEHWAKESSSGTGNVAFSTVVAHTGAQSVVLTNDKPRLETAGTNSIAYEAGKTYKMSFWRYIPAAVDFEAGNFRGGDAGEKIWYANNAAGTGSSSLTVRWGVASGATDPAKDTWVYVETTFTPDAGSDMFLRIQPVPTSGTVYTYYIDDFEISEYSTRP